MISNSYLPLPCQGALQCECTSDALTDNRSWSDNYKTTACRRSFVHGVHSSMHPLVISPEELVSIICSPCLLKYSFEFQATDALVLSCSYTHYHLWCAFQQGKVIQHCHNCLFTVLSPASGTNTTVLHFCLRETFTAGSDAQHVKPCPESLCPGAPLPALQVASIADVCQPLDDLVLHIIAGTNYVECQPAAHPQA